VNYSKPWGAHSLRTTDPARECVRGRSGLKRGHWTLFAVSRRTAASHPKANLTAPDPPVTLPHPARNLRRSDAQRASRRP
jgi:hypothetical protein